MEKQTAILKEALRIRNAWVVSSSLISGSILDAANRMVAASFGFLAAA